MTTLFQLNLKDIELTASVSDEIRTRAEKLDHFFDRIVRCRVGVEGPGRHHRQGQYAVRIDLAVPRKRILVRKTATANLELALKSAFDAAGRRLEDHARKLRG